MSWLTPKINWVASDPVTYTDLNRIESNINMVQPVASGSAVVGVLAYNGLTQSAGMFDGGTTNPAHTTLLNYDGSLRVTSFGVGGMPTERFSVAGSYGSIDFLVETYSGYVNIEGKPGASGYFDISNNEDFGRTRIFGIQGVVLRTGTKDPILTGIDAVLTSYGGLAFSGENLNLSGLGTSQVSGAFDAGTTNPAHTTRINLDADLHVHSLYTHGSATINSTSQFDGLATINAGIAFGSTSQFNGPAILNESDGLLLVGGSTNGVRINDHNNANELFKVTLANGMTTTSLTLSGIFTTSSGYIKANLPFFTNNAAAIAGGLTAGYLYVVSTSGYVAQVT